MRKTIAAQSRPDQGTPLVSTPPDALRPWSVSWPEYAPVDITPPELQAAGIATSAADGWAEPYLSPVWVTDWPQRLAAALVPYRLDEQGWPLNPTGRTGRTGRDLRKWGENAAADPIVITTDATGPRVLLIRRDDCGDWAIPGGMVEPGETALAAAVRELAEEAGVDLTDHAPTVLRAGYVDDPRNTDHAWVCSTAALHRVPSPVAATAGDDAVDVGWWPATNLAQLEAALAAAGERLYPAHRALLILAFVHARREATA